MYRIITLSIVGNKGNKEEQMKQTYLGWLKSYKNYVN